VIGGGPTADIRVLVGGRELTAETQLSRTSSMTGSRCMRHERYVTTRWSDDFVATSSDDMTSINCSAAVAAGQLPAASRATVLLVQCKYFHNGDVENFIVQIYVVIDCLKLEPLE
jgi:hypothetical protein